jgi:hypothetical protein
MEMIFSSEKSCDMTPERRKCAVREAQQKPALLDKDSLGTFKQRRMGTRIIEELLELVISIRFVPKL